MISDDDDLCDFVVPKSVSRPAALVKKTVIMPKQSIESSFLHAEPLCTSSQVIDQTFITIHIPSPPDNDRNSSIASYNRITDKPIDIVPIKSAASLLLDSKQEFNEPASFYSNDNISFFTSIIEEPKHLITEPLIINNTGNLIEELLNLSTTLLLPTNLPTESPMSPTIKEETIINNSASTPVIDLPCISENHHLLNAPFTSYPYVDLIPSYNPNYIHPCRCCLKTINFSTLLHIPQHLPKGGQIMCAECLLTFVSRPRDLNVHYFHRNLF